VTRHRVCHSRTEQQLVGGGRSGGETDVRIWRKTLRITKTEAIPAVTLDFPSPIDDSIWRQS